MRRYLLLISVLIFGLSSHAQTLLLTGRVTDQVNRTIPFATIYIKNSTYGTVSSEEGKYQLKLSPGNYNIVFRAPGYKEVIQKIAINDQGVQHNAQLTEENYTLKKLSGDSVMDIMKNVIGKREYYLRQVDKYSCVVYMKGVEKLDHAPKALMGQNVADVLSVDSTGKGILYQSESLSNYSFEQPDKTREEIIAAKALGQNPAFNYNKASDLVVNFYKDNFFIQGLSTHGFISPVASTARRYYQYDLVGSKIENGITIHKIKVVPKHTYDPVFAGYIYVVDGDWRLYGIDLMLTKKDNGINLVDTIRISQQYVPITDSVWLPLDTQYSFRGNVLGFQFEGYYLNVYNHYNLNPDFPDHYFNGERMRMDTIENSRDTAYWNRARPVPLTRQEDADFTKKELRAELERAIEKYSPGQVHKNAFLLLPYIPFGYKASYNNNKDSIYVDPFIQTVFYNTVEGAGVNLRGSYVHYLDGLRYYRITPDLRYGYANRQFNAELRAEYGFDPINRGKIIGGFGSSILDLSNVGTRSLYFNTLSTLLSEQNFVKFYRSEYGEIGYQRDIANGILLKADLSYANRTQLYNNSYYAINTYAGRRFTSNNPLAPDSAATDRSLLFPQNKALTLTTSLTFTIDQQYETRPTGRVYEPSPYPQIRVNYRKGIKGLLGSDVDYDFASVEVFQEHLNTGITGFSAFKFVAGDFFNRNKLYFMDYNHFQGNQGTTFDPTPGSFHFLPFYTYSANQEFIEAHFEHNFTGYLFNNIPGLRRLRLDEIIGVNYLNENNNHNYSEVYFGLQRFIFRVDYGFVFEGNHKTMQGFRIFYGIK